MKKIRKKILYAAVIVSALIPLSFVGNSYFEISKNLDIFATLYKEVNTYYVNDIEPSKFMKTGIDAMLESLDPYTNFITESDIEGYKFQTTGKYGGIGAIIRKGIDYAVVAEPYENFPAYKAGLRAGDIILEVDGKSTKGKSTDDISKILKGSPGTEVKLLIRKPGEKNDALKTLVREEIKINSVPFHGMVSEDVGYIRLTQFTDRCGDEVQKAFKDLKDNHPLKGIILDLRGNPGGLLNEAVNVANIFLDKGQEVVSTKGKVSEWDKSFTALNNAVDTKIPLCILTNGGSASASEIVSGCIQDLDRGIIIGQKSYGKGLVQTTRQLSYGTQLKVTTAHYYTPSGRCIQVLDYAHRNEDGSVGKIPDSLKTPFKTKSGRKVYDGGGIDPDVTLDQDKLSNVTLSLVQKNLFFDYATEYRLKHETIGVLNDFDLTDKDYTDFVSYLKDKDYDYTTKSEDALKDFQKNAEKEKYFTSIQTEFDNLKNKIQHDKAQDLVKFKDEIMDMLRQEIVSRYYFQNGRIQISLKNDPDIKKAVSLFENPLEYTATLNPK